MILDSGLDAACAYSAAPGSSSAYPTFAGFVQYAAFGTGSTAPAASDTALDAQVGSRSNNRGGFANDSAAGLDSTNDIIWAEVAYTRVFDISGNVNAAEWGLAPGSTGNLSVRELFRADPNDNGSSPITLTLESGDELQLVVTLRVQADWEYESKSFVITGTAGNDTAGTHTGNGTISTGTATSSGTIINALQLAWPGLSGLLGSVHGALAAILSDQTSVSKSGNLSAIGGSVYLTQLSYTPNNFYRDYTATFGTSDANGDHYAWAVGHPSPVNQNVGYRLILTSPTKLTKASTHKLTLTVRLSIARL